MVALALFVLLIAGLAVWSAIAAARAARAFPPEGEFVETGTEFAPVRIHYVDRGTARPGVAPVILIHGASGNLRDMTASLVPALEGHTRVIAIDRPGHGWSTRGPHPEISDPIAQARVIRDAMRQRGVERPVVLGHSWGAAVAASWARHYPDEISGVLLLSGALYPWPGDIAWYHRVVGTPFFGGAFLRILTVPGGSLLAAAGVKGNFHPDPAPEGYAERIGLPLLFRPSHFRANSADTAGLKARLAVQSLRYGEIAVPAIVVTGNADYTVSPKIHSYAFHNAVAGSELVKLKGAGHMPHHSRRAVVADAVLRLARGETPFDGMVTIYADGRVEREARASR
ncbi:alpha/beta hydrolase [Parvibaculum sp.]|uniref:alpha/beta fold hydrolase n=1 Tax=Parvibaculum sp. TaxID=2024848 RepID=UPI001D5F25CC|nr:alpha/beta hydrolase [Parvibaculum sp.]MBX3489075.1 alpha/beta hydrolase [Parvibaculum sp.]MCW5727056.1 alpha/beta hydrolase [Parvibaculum sp.]